MVDSQIKRPGLDGPRHHSQFAIRNPQSKRLSIIANPIAGRGKPYRLLDHYVKSWPYRDWQVEVLPTRGQGHAGELAESMLSRPPDLLAVCGGDGTMNEIVTRVPDPPFPVALLPAGTANVLARELRLPLDPIQALDVALDRAVRRVDVGQLEQGAQRRFLLMAGIGFDAYVVSQTWPRLKRRLGIPAFYISTVKALMTYSFPQFQVVTEERVLTATSCIVANAKGYGGGLVFTKQADMGDGLLDLLVLEGSSRSALIRLLLWARLGRPPEGYWIHRWQTKAAKIIGPSGALVQADGELVGALPVEIGLSPAMFPIVVPA